MPPSKSKSSLKAYSALFLTQKGDVEIGTIQGSTSGLTMDSIQAHYKKRQTMEPIGTYAYKSYTLFLFGTGTGKEGQENQHQLPPPYDMAPFYLDILLLASKDEDCFANPVPFQMAEYESFYTKSFGGYTSEDSQEEIDAGEVEIDDTPLEEEKDFPVDEEEADSDDEEEDDVEGGVEGGEGEVEAEDEPVAKKVKAAKKKKVVKNSNSVLTGTATAYPDKPILSENDQLQEEDESSQEVPVVPQRKRVISALSVLFKDMLSEQQIIQLEVSIYNGTIARTRQQNIVRAWTFPLFVHVYFMRAKQISSNFNPNSYVGNKDLFERYKSGEISIPDLSKMDIYELLPTQWEDQFKNRQIREKRQLEGNRSMATDIFLCTKCWKRECTYYEMQTRSADEPMTIFITCLNCGKHWRQ